MATSLDLARTYTSYSGVDIRVIINGAQVGSMQALSYAIQREKAPIYVMGSVDPISYSRGKRGIAGTMISLMMDTHILMSPSFTGEYYLGDADEIFAMVGEGTDKGNKIRGSDSTKSLNNVANESLAGGVGLTSLGLSSSASGGVAGAGIGSTNVSNSGGAGQPGANGSGAYQRNDTNFRTLDVNALGNNYRIAPVFYVDQILPFDIAIVAANEYGQSAQMRLYGCEILNEGSGFSIDDIVIENQMTYVCRTILPWRSFDLQDVRAAEGGSKPVPGSARNALYSRLATPANRGANTTNAGGDSTITYQKG
jgi:hypothetical protein